MMSSDIAPIEVFCSYARKDKSLLGELEVHLSMLKRQGLISTWHDGEIVPGTDKAQAIDERVEQALVILLLVSPNYLASDSCSGVEMRRAIERHEAGRARVIPIIIRSCDWTHAPFAGLQYLPSGGKPIAGRRNRDSAWNDVVAGIRRAIEGLSLLTVNAPRSVLPSVWNIPYPRNPFFMGRDDLFLRLYTELQRGEITALSQPQAISGLGGIGKTQIAVEYAYQHRQEYQAVLWTLADTRESLISGYIALAKLLNLPEQDQQIAIQAVKTWLQAQGSWLLILDNADDLTLVRDFLPSVLGGHVLLTTRAQVTGKLAYRIEVDIMPQDVGALFLLRRAKLVAPSATLADVLDADVIAARKIWEELGGLPLALDQAGAYIEINQCSLSDYQRRYQMRGAYLLRQRGDLTDDHPEPVTTTWSLSFEKAEQRCPAAGDLLRICAFLAADAIPEEIVTQGSAHLGMLLQSVVSDPFLLDEAISALGAYSLLRRDTSKRMLSIHRLVQAVLKDAMKETEQQLWAERVVRVVSAVFPPVEHATWTLCERLLPHAFVAAEFIEQGKIMLLEGPTLLNRIGYYLTERARYTEAEPLLKYALLMNEQLLGSEHPNTANSLNHLAELHFIQGKYNEAQSCYQQALKIREKTLGSIHADVAKSLNNLARFYTIQGKYEEAYSLCQRALMICEKVLGSEYPDTVTSLNHLADIYRRQGEYGRAKPLYQRALMICEKVLGPDHPDIAANLNHLAGLYLDQGEYGESELLYQRALKIREDSLGFEHPYTATSLNNLARIYEVQKRYGEASLYYQQALAIYEKVLGPEHLYTATSLSNLAGIYQAQEKYGEASLCYQRALAIYEKVLGPEHPNMAISLHGLARLYRIQKEYEQAELLYQQALVIYEKALGPEHPYTAISLHALARLYYTQEKYEEADFLYQRAIAIYKKALGSKHPDTIRALEDYAQLLQKTNREN